MRNCRFWVGLINWIFLQIVFCPNQTKAQITFIVDTIPAYTPGNDTLYLVGNFNDWNPRDTAYRMQKNAAGHFFIQGHRMLRPIEFKITRGDWSKVEGSELGLTIDNRIYNQNNKQDTIRIQVQSWEDLVDHIPFDKKIKLKVYDIPTSTPDDASLYVAGNFNGWNPGDRNYRLQEELDGVYTVWIPVRDDTVQYKFTRGNWSSIEGAENGRARSNRLYVNAQTTDNLIPVSIKTWEDLSGDPINAYTFLLLLAAFQGLLLIIAINTIQDNNETANRILSVLILLISVALIGRVSTYGREIFQWQPRLLLLPDVIYFLYGPIFLWYIQSLLTVPAKNRFGKWVHFIPAILHLIAYIPLLMMDTSTFTSRVVDFSLKKYFISAAALALLFNAFYWWHCYRLIKNYAYSTNKNFSFEQNLQYLSTVINLKLVSLLVWAFTYVIGGFAWATGQDWVWLTDKLTDVVWIFLSLTVFFLGYFAMKQPEIFRLTEQEVEEETAPVSAISNPEISSEMSELKTELERIMELEKPYLNPRLALSDLADMADTNVHTLSRLINEGFDKNFYDFVNGYRVEEFKKRIISPEFKNQTFLSIAYSVGFNSKTAFNRSFKKLTNNTPRKFLKEYEAQSPK